MSTSARRNRRAHAFALTLGLCTLSGIAAAQQPSAAQASAIRQACRGDYMAYCSGVPTGAPAFQCLQQNAASVSGACKQALQAASGAAVAVPVSPTSLPRAVVGRRYRP